MIIAVLILITACGTQKPATPLPVDPTPDWGISSGNGAAGKTLALKYCTSCHVVDGKGQALKGAPPFAQTVARDDIDAAWLRRWIQDPLLQKPGTLMPNLGLSDSEIEHLIAFLYSTR